ncbi:hypothetical protein [uncultured Ruminococcus sp.]|uniref:hypothetical protein n=1 Tax=uncultured Ruminococcus sp. TaxID=165186 RepID=UPI002625F8B3|nr:hypothetical protein [uncultured Ruminococcus sp.]
MISFRLGRTAVRIDFSFLVFNAMVFLVRDGRSVLSFYTVCALHEAGHLAVLTLTGGSAASVCFTAAGIRIDTRKTGASPVLHDMAVLLAGPAVNAAVYAAMGIMGRGGEFAALNLMAAVYNMLPYRSLDGGALIALLTAGSSAEQAADLILAAVKLLMTAAAAWAVYIYGREALPLLIGGTALFIGDLRPRKKSP